MASIGKQLHHARENQGLSIDDVAFRTHIPASKLSDLENDDFSNFANLTYAKGFLKLYSRFLEVDISHYLEQFSVRDLAEVSGHEYIHGARATMNLPTAAFSPDPPRRGIWLLMAGLVLLVGVPIYFLRKDKDKDEPAPPPPSASAVLSPARENSGPETARRPSAPPERGNQEIRDDTPVEVRPAMNVPTPKATVIDDSEEEEADPRNESVNAGQR